MISKKYYDVLGVSRNSSENDIKIAYRQLAKKYHPDLNKELDAKKKFMEIQKAYETILNLPTETLSFFQSSAIPSIDDLFKEMFSKENVEKRKKERERPKPMSEVLKDLIDDITGYCLEILDVFFIDTNSEIKQTFADWNDNFEELKEEIKNSWKHNLEEGECVYNDNCPITEEMEEKECEKLCRKCIEEDKKEWYNIYKRSVDIGFAYLRAYLEATPKHYKPLRKEYSSKKVKTGSIKNWLMKEVDENESK